MTNSLIPATQFALAVFPAALARIGWPLSPNCLAHLQRITRPPCCEIPNCKKEQIFAQDEMGLKEVGRHWTRKDLLSQEGVFFLKDTVNLLQINSAMIKRQVQELRQENLSAWKTMGVRKIWNHWIIRMKVFAPYYEKHLKSKAHKLRGIIDANTLLNKTGFYYLTDVCRYLPFSAHQLRYQAKNNPNARNDYGLWKDQKLNAFIVDMEVFSKWVKRLWAGHFSDQKPKKGASCNPIAC